MGTGLPGLPPPGFLGEKKGLPGLPAPGFLEDTGGWTGDNLVASEPASPGQLMAGGIANMIPLNLGDEAMAGLSALRDKAVYGSSLSDAYDQNLAQIRDYEGQFRDQHPAASIFSSLAGNAPAAVFAPSMIPAKAAIGTKLAAAAAEGGLWGAGYGFGAGEGGAENRTREAAKQALAGEVVAPAITGTLSLAGWLASIPGKTGDFVRGLFQSPESIAAEKLAPAAKEILDLPATSENPFFDTQTLANATQSPYLAQMEQQLGKSSSSTNDLLNTNRIAREDLQLKQLAGLSESAAGTNEEAGIALRGLLEPEANRARDAAQELFGAIDPKRQARIPLSYAREPFEQTIGTMYEAGGTPKSIAGIARDISALDSAEEPSLAGFSYMHSLRQRAQDAWVAAKNTQDNRAAAAAQSLVQSIDSAIKQAGEQGMMAPSAVAQFDAAKAAYSEFARTYQNGPVGLALQKMGEGNYNFNASSVPNFFFNGKPESTRALLNALPDSPEALDAARGALRDKILNDRRLVNNDGVISPGNFRTWLRTNKDALTATGKDGRQLLDPEHVQSLERISEDLGFLDPNSSTSSRQLAYQASKGQPTTAQALLMQDLFGEIPGFVPGASIANKVLESLSRSKSIRVNEVLSRAMEDKGYAKALLLDATPERVSALRTFLDLSSSAASKGADVSAALSAPVISQIFPREYGVTQTRGEPSKPSAPKLLSLSRQEDKASSSYPIGSSGEDLASKVFSVPAPILDAVKAVESSGDANAVGKPTKYGTAKGAYQLLDSTGEEYHKKLGIKEPYDPFNEPQARMIAAAYLADLIAQFGDLGTALTAYHTGPGNVKKGIIGPVGRDYARKVFEKV